MASPPDITALLDDWSRGNERALDRLLPLVYAELRQIAPRQLRRERMGHTLQPTALVHEAYLVLVDQRQVTWRSRAHFFGVAAQVMRRILVDSARRHHANKRGDGIPCVPLDEAIEAAARAAHVLKVWASTAKREWRTAKAWLSRELGVQHP
jgi:RNA polymerase sigma factor (TIGR02999 family)